MTVLDVEFDEEIEYQIVGSQEANPTIGRISDDSPLGRGMMGHTPGDVIRVEAPVGELEFKILKVTY